MASFEAKFPGRCADCRREFGQGEMVEYDGEDRIVASACCGSTTEDGQDRERVSAVAEVMPRGRTARDRCSRCFIIPAANGVCGC